MNYYLDCEFNEGFHKPLFGKRRHFIDLISIGIICEDGREYYAISNEFNYKNADGWVKENVIEKLETYVNARLQAQQTVLMPFLNNCSGMRSVKFSGRSNKQIVQEIYEFVCPYSIATDYAGVESITKGADAYLKQNPPEFYGYYADYDWVLFCSLFGRMIDLPKGFPMYCKDLKQMLDEKVENYTDHFSNGNESFETKLSWIKNKDSYPKQANEHNALSDAKWNKQLHEFINKL